MDTAQIWAERRAETMLQLGRLDGRLRGSPCTDIFLAKARLHGAVALAGLAGVPIDISDLQDWITGRTPPPRASEGLNDPISVAAVFHLAISRDDDSRDPILRATLNALRTVLDDRSAAALWGGDDLAHYGPLWRIVRQQAALPFPKGGLRAIADRVFSLADLTRASSADAAEVVTVDGRALSLPSRAPDRNWLIAVAVPTMLFHARVTTRVIPSFVLLPKFLPATPAKLADMMAESLAKAVRAGLQELDAIETQAGNLVDLLSVTRRSRAPLLARLQLAYPGLQPKAVAQLLEISPQGARKLLLAANGHIRTNGGQAPRG
ncbi:MAG: hypothetical protein JF564_05440 [Sphingomonas sp.]|nr:hypothetical protein [Sphingomonas sp.]